MIEMWQCEWVKWKQEDEEVRAFVEGMDLEDLLDPHEAFFGGCTTRRGRQGGDSVLQLYEPVPVCEQDGQVPGGPPQVHLRA